jgi:hypothetical protein
MREIDYDPIVKSAYETARQADESGMREPDHAIKAASIAVAAGLRTFALHTQQLVMDGDITFINQWEHEQLMQRWDQKVADQRKMDNGEVRP